MDYTFQRGRYAANGLPAYHVVATDEPTRPTGLVWYQKQPGQRAGDWTYEMDGFYGIPCFGRWFYTRAQAAEGLLGEIRLLAESQWGSYGA